MISKHAAFFKLLNPGDFIIFRRTAGVKRIKGIGPAWITVYTKKGRRGFATYNCSDLGLFRLPTTDEKKILNKYWRQDYE